MCSQEISCYGKGLPLTLSLNTCFVMKSSEGAVEMFALPLCIPYLF